jgi:16S rRNA (guanine(966)-N(2))-methyltransferase RsmD
MKLQINSQNISSQSSTNQKDIKHQTSKTGRVITGSAKSIPLLIPPNSRAVTDAAKSALFSMIAEDLADKDILDLYAGSGSFGIESLSRGAASATFVEMSPKAVEFLEANVKKCKLEAKSDIRQEDVYQFLFEAKEESFDIVFADPPFKFYKYDSESLIDLLEQIYPVIPDGGGIVIKHPENIQPREIDNLILADSRNYGKSTISIWVKKV